MNELDLFAAALAIGDPADRAEMLDRECADRPVLRGRLNQLLEAHVRSNQLLDIPEPDRTRTPTENVVSAGSLAAETVGTVIANKYKLLQQIGEGGMGSVWMADQTEPVKRRVAVKLIRVDRGSSKTILSRFDAERQAIALMDHPNIAKLLDAGTSEAGQPYFIMELVKGIPLTEYCDAHKLGIPDRLNLFMQICSAVQHAHQKGIIHRDLKPSNILVESHDNKPVPRVIDFGLAKAISGIQLTEQTLFTAFGHVMGTPLYMAPEQAKFNAVDVDTRADVFALGVILYELLTGSTPLTPDTMKKAALEEMLRLVREQEAPTPSSRFSSSDAKPSIAANRQIEPAKLSRIVKGELDWIVLKALSKERDRRYETANGFAKDIERFLNNEPVQAGPPSASYRLRKFVRRNRPQVIAVGLVLFTLVAGMAGTTLGLLEALRQEGLAVEARNSESERAEGERVAKVEAETKRIEAEKQRSLAQAEKEKAVKATLAETAALEQTRQRLSQIEKGVDLLASLLLGINPRIEANQEMGGPSLYELLRERASKAAGQLDAESIGDAQAVARLQTILGDTLRNLGEFPRAIALLEKACATRERELGDNNPDTLVSRGILCQAYQAAGKLDLAIPLFERTLKAFEATRGDDHPDTLTTRNNLATAYQAAGKLNLAIPLYERTLKAQETKQGNEHPCTLNTRNNLASAYQAAGNLDLAIPLLERTLKAQEARLGDDHLDTLTTRKNLANAYKAIRRLDLAIPLYERTLNSQESKLGNEHPDTLSSRNNLAGAYFTAGKLDLAIPLYERTLKARESKLGNEHPDTLSSRNNLARVYHSAGKMDLAIPLYIHTLMVRESKLGIDHPDTLISCNNLAGAYQTAGKLDLAIPLLERTLKAQEAKLGVDHPTTITIRNNLAGAYHAVGNLDLAIPLCEQSARGIESRRYQHEHAQFIIYNAIVIYEAAKQFDKAEVWRRKWLGVLQQQSGSATLAYASELVGLGVNLLQQQKWTAAEAPLRDCLAIREKTQPDAWSTFNTQSVLGAALLGQKKYAEAEPLLLAGYQGMKKREKMIPPQWSTRIPDALDRIIDFYTATNKPDEVKKWRAERAKYLDVAPMPREKK